MARTSNKREQILNFLTQFMNEHGYAPTVREICNAVGLQSTATVHYHLNALRDAGLIEMDEMKKRAISLPDAQRADRIPVVGVVTAGVPILDGDKVVVRPQPDAENGQIVVALLDDSATVKRLKKTGRDVWLMPENPSYEPIPGNEAKILGRVKALIREY